MTKSLAALGVVGILATIGCQREWRFHGSPIKRTLEKLEDEEIIELTYSWHELLVGPPRKFRRAAGSTNDRLVCWPADLKAHVPTYHVCADITKPVIIAELTELDRELVTAGFYGTVGAPGQPWKRTWTYRAPPGARERAAQLLNEAVDRLEADSKSVLPDLPFRKGPVVMREITRTAFIWSGRITPWSCRRFSELTRPLPAPREQGAPASGEHREFPVRSFRICHAFPTLALVVNMEAHLLREGEHAKLRSALSKALEPIIALDGRHHVWPDDGPLPPAKTVAPPIRSSP